MSKQNKILAIASAGGHWVQLQRLKPSFIEEGNEVLYVSTKSSFADTVKGHKFYCVPDASRWNKLKLIYMGLCIAKIIILERPDVIITTGAAPGLMGIIFGKLLGKCNIWVDSIANTEQISLSGRIAKIFADRIYTQWPHLSNSKILFNGNVLS